MADKYHINPATGRPGKCSATHQCRFGGDKNHFPSKEAAQKAIEKALQEFVVPEGKKKQKPSQEATEKARAAATGSCGSDRPASSCGSTSPAPRSTPPPPAAPRPAPSVSCASAPSLRC